MSIMAACAAYRLREIRLAPRIKPLLSCRRRAGCVINFSCLANIDRLFCGRGYSAGVLENLTVYLYRLLILRKFENVGKGIEYFLIS